MCQSQEIGESSVQTNIRDSNSYLLNFQFFGQKLSIYWIKNESLKWLYFLIEFSSISLEKTHGDFIRFRHFELSGFLEKDLLPFRIKLRLVRGCLGLVEEAYELLLLTPSSLCGGSTIILGAYLASTSSLESAESKRVLPPWRATK